MSFLHTLIFYAAAAAERPRFVAL